MNGIKIHYEIVGNGPQTVLLLPGAIGSTRSDFGPQLEKLNRDKYTIVAWDPPGYGFSRPPDRHFDNDFYRKDSQLANQLMNLIKRPEYSLIGWSDGGITALIMAALYPDNVRKLVSFGSSAFITDKDLELVLGQFSLLTFFLFPVSQFLIVLSQLQGTFQSGARK